MRKKLLKAMGCGAVAAATTLVVGLPMAHAAGAAEAQDGGQLRTVACDFNRTDQLKFQPFVAAPTCYDGIGEVAVNNLWQKPVVFASGSHTGWLSYKDASGADKTLHFAPGQSHQVSAFALKTLHVDS